MMYLTLVDLLVFSACHDLLTFSVRQINRFSSCLIYARLCSTVHTVAVIMSPMKAANPQINFLFMRFSPFTFLRN